MMNRLWVWLSVRSTLAARIDHAWFQRQAGRAVYPRDWRTGLEVLREALEVEDE